MTPHPSWMLLLLAGLVMVGLAGATLAWRPAPPPGSAEWLEDGAPGSSLEPTAQQVAGESEELPELSAGDEAPDFDLPLIGGGRVVLEDVLDEQPVLLVIWAVWCPPCVAEFQELQRLHEKYAERGLEILAVGVRFNQTLEDVRLFARDQGVEFPVLYDEREKVVQQYGISYIPTNILIGRDGVVEYSAYSLFEDLEERIESLLEQI